MNTENKEDIKYMKAALKQAEKAIAIGEVPIGAVIVYEGKIIARGYNRRNTDKTTLAHAEIACIRKACKKVGDWRLEDCTIYITLEPCPMCAGAILWANIRKVYYGCTIADTDAIGFRDQVFYEQGCADSEELCRSECQELFREYSEIQDKQTY